MLSCFIFHTGASVSCSALGHWPQCGDASPTCVKTVPFPQQDTAASMGCWWCLSLTERKHISLSLSFPTAFSMTVPFWLGGLSQGAVAHHVRDIFERSGNQSCEMLVVHVEKESTNFYDHKDQPCTGAAERATASWSWACNTPSTTEESGSVFIPWMLRCWWSPVLDMSSIKKVGEMLLKHQPYPCVPFKFFKMAFVLLLGHLTPCTSKTILKCILCDHFLTSAFLFARVHFGDTESSKSLSSEKELPSCKWCWRTAPSPITVPVSGTSQLGSGH